VTTSFAGRFWRWASTVGYLVPSRSPPIACISRRDPKIGCKLDHSLPRMVSGIGTAFARGRMGASSCLGACSLRILSDPRAFHATALIFIHPGIYAGSSVGRSGLVCGGGVAFMRRLRCGTAVRDGGQRTYRNTRIRILRTSVLDPGS
jgi:hypothetical protein